MNKKLQIFCCFLLFNTVVPYTFAQEPRIAFLSQNHLFSEKDTDKFQGKGFEVISLFDGSQKDNSLWTIWSSVRWKVTGSRFWINKVWRWPAHAQSFFDTLNLDRLVQGKLVTGFGKGVEDPDSINNFCNGRPLEDAVFLGRFTEFLVQSYSDFLPIAENGFEFLVLSNVRGGFKESGKAKNIVFNTIDIADQDTKRPHWSLWVWEYQGKWSEEKASWEEGKWTKKQALPVTFKEAFWCFREGDYYAFVTESGKIYHYRQNADKSWATEEVSLKAGYRLEAFVTDVDQKTTYIFCNSKERDKKDFFFKLERNPTPQYFKSPPPNNSKGGVNSRILFGYAMVLASEGKIKIKKSEK